MNLSHILQSCHTLHNPVEHDAVEEREHEQRTTKQDVLTVIRVPRSTIRASTVLSSRMFHGLSPLEFHGVVIEGLEPCFASMGYTWILGQGSKAKFENKVPD